MIKINGQEIGTKRFPNGESNLDADKIKTAMLLQSEPDTVRVEFKYESDADLIELMFIKDYIDELQEEATSPWCVLDIYYMPYSRMDRKIEGQVFTLEYVAKFINFMNFNYVFLNEPHSKVSQILLNKCQDFYHNETLLPLVKDEVNFDEKRDYIVFPDEGAVDRYKHSEMLVNNSLVGIKNRDLKTGKIESLEITGKNKYKGNKAIIVDDLSSYGGTFVRTAKLLREQGFKDVYLLVGHAENAILDGDVFSEVDKVFTTDSILDTSSESYRLAKQFDRIKVYPMSEEITGWE